ncbi:MAG: homocysteine S-methyltransferase [Gemmatimonadetes bacterium]|nr:homocysteine S-methyltransferase [Gemmatimonadota bacterium]
MHRLLDGASGTELTRRGHDISDALWAARLLLDAPEAITAVHRDYFDAGADVVTTMSYQASRSGFAARGVSADETDALLARSVELARAAERAYHEASGSTRPTFVAASIGPYGATLADGSEFHGEYGLTEDQLFEFHRERLPVLWAAGPDFLACETIPSALEVRAIVRALREVPAARAWVSVQCRDAGHTAFGDDVTALAASIEGEPQVIALGMNCLPPERVAGLARRMRAGTSKPLLAYPNSGELWNAETRGWDGAPTARRLADWVAEFEAAGISWMGGCCRTTPSDIAEVARVIGRG